MINPSQSDMDNRLLAVMSEEDFGLLASKLQPVDLPKGIVLVEAGSRIEHIYFPEVGIASVVATSPAGHLVEAGLFGRDGAGPVPGLSGIEIATNKVLIQVVGQGHRIGLRDLMTAVAESATLARLFTAFTHIMNVQTSFTALSNAVHSVDERLARWILMCHDRHPSDDIPLTHEYMSVMLAVRRPSVTTALHILEGHRLIRMERGQVIVRDRLALEAFATDSYGQPEREYRRMIGLMS